MFLWRLCRWPWNLSSFKLLLVFISFCWSSPSTPLLYPLVITLAFFFSAPNCLDMLCILSMTDFAWLSSCRLSMGVLSCFDSRATSNLRIAYLCIVCWQVCPQRQSQNNLTSFLKLSCLSYLLIQSACTGFLHLWDQLWNLNFTRTYKINFWLWCNRFPWWIFLLSDQ